MRWLRTGYLSRKAATIFPDSSARHLGIARYCSTNLIDGSFFTLVLFLPLLETIVLPPVDHSMRLAVLSSAVTLLHFGAAFASAATSRGLRCETNWQGPNSTNDIGQCFSTQHLLDYLLTPERLTVAIIGALLIFCGFFEFLWCPLFTCFRYCCNCCGGRSRRPDGCCCGDSDWDDRPEELVNRAYTKSTVYCTKITALVVVALGIASVVITAVGTALLLSMWPLLFQNVQDLINYIVGKVNEIKNGLTVTNDDGSKSLVAGLSLDMFKPMDDLVQNLAQQLYSLRQQGDPYIQQAADYSLIAVYVPIIVFLLTLACMIFNIRSIIPIINNFLCWIIVLIFGLIGGVFVILSIIFVDIEAERQKVISGEPGIINWYLIPMIEQLNVVGTLESTVRTLEASQSYAACNQFAKVCVSDSTTWSYLTPSVIFHCNITAATNCTTIAEVGWAMASLTVLNGSPFGCSNVSSQVGQCTLPICAETCNQTDTKALAKTAVKVLSDASAAANVFYNIILPFLNVKNLFKAVFGYLTVFQVLSDSTQLVGAGFSIYAATFLVNMVVMFRGQKRFFSYPDDPEQDQPQRDDELTVLPPPPASMDALAPAEGVVKQPADLPPLAYSSSNYAEPLPGSVPQADAAAAGPPKAAATDECVAASADEPISRSPPHSAYANDDGRDSSQYSATDGAASRHSNPLAPPPPPTEQQQQQGSSDHGDAAAQV